MWQTISVRKYEKLGKHLLYCSQHRVIFSTYYEGLGHSPTTYAKFYEKLLFLTPKYAHVRIKIFSVFVYVENE